MRRAQGGVGEGIGPFGRDGRHVDDADSAKFLALVFVEGGAVVDGNFVAATGQPGGHLFHEGFKSGIATRDAARTEKGDFQM